MFISYDEKFPSITESIHFSLWSVQGILWDVKIASVDFTFVTSVINWILMILQINSLIALHLSSAQLDRKVVFLLVSIDNRRDV